MRTALGDPVEPDVSCCSAMSLSAVSIGSISVPDRMSSIFSTVMPRSSRIGAATSNGAPRMTAFASIIRTTVSVSAPHTARSVRGVG